MPEPPVRGLDTAALAPNGVLEEPGGRQVLCSWVVNSGQVPTSPASEPPPWPGAGRMEGLANLTENFLGLLPLDLLNLSLPICPPPMPTNWPEVLLQTPYTSHSHDHTSSECSLSHHGLQALTTMSGVTHPSGLNQTPPVP